MIRILFAFVVSVHGLIHLMGFVKAFRLAALPRLTQEISKPMGLVWLLCDVVFMIAVFLLLLEKEWWWMIATAGVCISQLLIIVYWKDARFGTTANVILVGAIAIGYGRWSFQSMTRNELTSFLSSAAAGNAVTLRDVPGKLPVTVRRWLGRSNVDGSGTARTLHLRQRGELRSSPDGKWMQVDAEQWRTTQRPGFFWLASVAALPGIDLVGRDKYEEGKGQLQRL